MDPESYSDFDWLTSESAEEYLQTAIRMVEENLNPLKTAKLLRKSISPQQAALVMEQAQLRFRARRKFENAKSMFFTGRSLEQSTSSLIATYKAKRFRKSERVADICCGIGGDLISLSQRGQGNLDTVGVDQDPVACLFAKANLGALGIDNVNVERKSFENFDLDSFDGVHIDPDRRTKGRTVKGGFFDPPLPSVIERLSLDRQRVAIKVAPATEPEAMDFPVKREWIGTWRECKQQVLWTGANVDKSQRIATVVSKSGARFRYRALEAELRPRAIGTSDEIGPYIYEPHATILAAGLGDSIALKYSLEYLCRDIAYMNSDRIITGVEPILKGYRVEEVLPVDLKTIQQALKKLNIGQLTVKKRGVDQVLADKVARLKLEGDEKAIIMLTRHAKIRRAILVTRVGKKATNVTA